MEDNPVEAIREEVAKILGIVNVTIEKIMDVVVVLMVVVNINFVMQIIT